MKQKMQEVDLNLVEPEEEAQSLYDELIESLCDELIEGQQREQVLRFLDFALLGKYDEFELYDEVNWDEKILFLNAWTPPRHAMTEEECQAFNDKLMLESQKDDFDFEF